MVTKREILAYAKQTYDVDPDYPFQTYPDYAVLRHKNSRKWFGVLMTVSPGQLGWKGKDALSILNVKCDPVLSGSIRQEPGVLPAYHMNKEHWLTLVLQSNLPKEKILSLLDLSHQLTQK